MFDLEFPPFRPHPLLTGGHAQTIAAAYLPGRRIAYRAARRLVPLDDGDGIVLHDDRPVDWRPGDAVAILLHGLAGSHASPYLTRIAGKLNARGVRTYRMDLRGCGAGFAQATRPFHAGQSDDAWSVLRQVAADCPESPLSLVGFSLSGNIVLKLAAESATRPLAGLRQVVAVAPPIDLKACADNLRRGASRLYDRSFLRALQRMRRQRSRAGYLDVPREFVARRLSDFDQHYTAPLSGFLGADDYYRRASSAPLLARIRVPTLILTAEDDPLIPCRTFHRVSLSPTTRLVTTSRGGHLGYLAARGDDPDWRWMDWRIVQVVTRTDGTDPVAMPRKDGEIGVNSAG